MRQSASSQPMPVRTWVLPHRAGSRNGDFPSTDSEQSPHITTDPSTESQHESTLQTFVACLIHSRNAAAGPKLCSLRGLPLLSVSWLASAAHEGAFMSSHPSRGTDRHARSLQQGPRRGLHLLAGATSSRSNSATKRAFSSICSVPEAHCRDAAGRFHAERRDAGRRRTATCARSSSIA